MSRPWKISFLGGEGESLEEGRGLLDCVAGGQMLADLCSYSVGIKELRVV